MSAVPNQASVSQLRALAQTEMLPDQTVDMFSARGFELAQRIAKAYANSDAVPAAFRLMVEKRDKGGVILVENPAALGNCIVAIETARAVGMSITAVMQHANVIEGRLSWSAQFVIAAINASGRFTPLRFDMKNRGRIKATYREKKGWNQDKRGYDFENKTVEVDDVVCVAWALPRGVDMPSFSPEDLRKFGGSLLDLVRAYGLPVVESAPVSMKLAVEEGWYSKSGSKWQTEMRDLMLQYRAGAFFGRVHAPDIVMGMGRHTSEEMVDMTTVDVDSAGRVTAVTTEQLSRPPQPVQAVQQVNEPGSVDAEPPAAEPAPAPAPSPAAPAFDADAFAERMEKCKDLETLDLMADEIRSIASEDARATLTDFYKRCRQQLVEAAATQAPAPAPVSRRRTTSGPSVE